MKENISLLLGYLRTQKETTQAILGELRKKKKASSKEEATYLGYLLHNLYCALEDFFQEVTKTFENRIEDPSKYHRELLKRMHIEMPALRPRVLSKESYQALDELRGFRHIFRHSYDYDLSPIKLDALKERVLSMWKVISRDLDLFESFLEEYLET